MIESDAQLKVTQAQIQRLESALAVLRQTATPAEFAAQAPVVIEHIRRMRGRDPPHVGCMIIASSRMRMA